MVQAASVVEMHAWLGRQQAPVAGGWHVVLEQVVPFVHDDCGVIDDTDVGIKVGQCACAAQTSSGSILPLLLTLIVFHRRSMRSRTALYTHFKAL